MARFESNVHSSKMYLNFIGIVGYMPMESKSGEEPTYLCFPF